MRRREFLKLLPAGGLLAVSSHLAFAAADFRRLLVLVELKGGNDGLNTVVHLSLIHISEPTRPY